MVVELRLEELTNTLLLDPVLSPLGDDQHSRA